jgi:ubiquinone/menaquinone biosynthesis C-methylase UbiE
MENYKEKYYEQKELWIEDLTNNPNEKLRLKETLEIIPDDVKSVLDVGCGNGFLTNVLVKSNYERLIGLDCSSEALKHVKSETILGNISKLPFEENSFDLVTCLETIEHLPENDSLIEGITELQRVAKKYIIISVPNEEVLENSLVRCFKCSCCFHPNFHMRSFNKEKIKNLFKDFRVIKLKEIGHKVRIYSYPSFFAMINFYYCNWKSFPSKITSICPQCGYQFRNKETNEEYMSVKIKSKVWKTIFHFSHLLGKILGKIFHTSKRKAWLVVLYKKNDK